MSDTRTAPSGASDRLDRVVPRLFGEISRGAARRLIAAGAVFLNGKRCRVSSRMVHPGDRVRIERTRPAPAAPAAALVVLYEDDGIIAIDKPAGMPSAPTRGAAAGTAFEVLQAQLRARDGVVRRLWLVHRLDTGTSGALLFAATAAAAATLSGSFRRHHVVKRYRAVVAGEPAADAGTVDEPLQSAEGRANVDPSGKASRTDWRVLYRSAGRSLVEAVPLSGRMHQIRAHLAAIGCPIVGDPLYGGPPASRLMLHAVALEVPWQGRALCIEAPLPSGFETHDLQPTAGTADV